MNERFLDEEAIDIPEAMVHIMETYTLRYNTTEFSNTFSGYSTYDSYIPPKLLVERNSSLRASAHYG